MPGEPSMTTISANSTIGISLDSYKSPVVIKTGVTITNPSNPDAVYTSSASVTSFVIQNDGTIIGGGSGTGTGVYLAPGGSVTNAAANAPFSCMAVPEPWSITAASPVLALTWNASTWNLADQSRTTTTLRSKAIAASKSSATPKQWSTTAASQVPAAASLQMASSWFLAARSPTQLPRRSQATRSAFA